MPKRRRYVHRTSIPPLPSTSDAEPAAGDGKEAAESTPESEIALLSPFFL
jgi:hypothetical protein